jgi:hypothetical protein
MNKIITILLVALIIAGFLVVMDGVGHNPLAAGTHKATSGDCLADRVDGDLFPHSDPYCISGDTSEPVTCTAKNPVNCRNYDNKKKDNSTPVVSVPDAGCKMVTVIINQWHSYEECR